MLCYYVILYVFSALLWLLKSSGCC